MLDTIGKNLGTVEKNVDEDEFRDHKIFRLMVKFLSEFARNNSDRVQLILINNNVTEDVAKEDIIIQFDGNGTQGLKYGLIDDMT
jgi:hypothetical protein